MNTKVLLTGATGFVGRQILKSLLSKDVEITLVTRKPVDLGDARARVRVVYTEDLFSSSDIFLSEICESQDVLIHSAWYAEPGKYLTSSINLDCLVGTLRLAKVSLKQGVRKFVGLGTCFEYDLSFGLLDVTTPLLPTTPYAAAKVSAFLTLSEYFKNTLVDFAWCRLFNLYGEGEDERRLYPYIRACMESGVPAELTSGNQLRDFIDVCVAAEMMTRIALGSASGPFNICSGIGVSVKDFAFEVAKIYKRPDLLRFGVRPENLVDPLKVVGVPNFEG
jgi:nucleoside-diphosphate-sugar epimerase